MSLLTTKQILKGTLVETRYEWPDERKGPAKTKIKETVTHKRNQVTYMSDKHGLYRMYNPEPFEYAVSLHVYTAPNAVIDGCKIFNEATGKSKHVKEYEYYSKFGKLCGS
ncbi:MAG: hypothetical protein Q9183_004748 [Haloplaca sp. 2 TL-2023]